MPMAASSPRAWRIATGWSRAVATLGLALFLFGGMAWYWGVGIARRLPLPTDFDFVVLFGVRLTVTRLIALGIALAMVAASACC